MIQKALQRLLSQRNDTRQSGVAAPGSAYFADVVPEAVVLKSLFNIVETFKREMPAVVVLDTKGYFHGELQQFSDGCARMFKEAAPFKVLAIGNKEQKDSLTTIASDWCDDSPFDPVLIVQRATLLLSASGQSDTGVSDTDVLRDDLIGFLKIK
ncbi:MAG: hypothetical protein L7F77_02690 [Candidatus Magnetominusculus sp. LBB02]|nr:hypothetical protein [Candidatus Magnetominusculus sp. LBB02]